MNYNNDNIKVKIDNKRQNSKCDLYGDRYKTVHLILSECSKLTQKKYKTWHDWVGKVTNWELCKILEFDLANKWYLHKPESVQKNETYKIFW